MSDKINNSVERILESIDGMEQAASKPFLLTRINAALNNAPNKSVWYKIAFYLKKPVVAAIAIMIVLLVNIIVITKRNNLLEREIITKSIAPPKYDFAINVSVMYDTENQEP
ncbi:MAG: hypothetical protein LH615_07785 [Ferruginibacter sp.]|nr:hypothetical protein [Ferruginibacter sp.]